MDAGLAIENDGASGCAGREEQVLTRGGLVARRMMTHSGWPLLAMWLGCVGSSAAAQGLVDAPSVILNGAVEGQAQSNGGTQSPVSSGEVNGAITDSNGDIVSGADVILTREGTGDARKTATVSDGRFHFGGVGAGKFKINVTFKGFTPGSFAGVLGAGEVFEVPALKLDMVSATDSVDVVASEEDLAQAEVKVQEHQRLAGIMPNFFVSYDWHAAPLTPHQKFELSWRSVLDPANIGINAIIAGVQQSQNSISGYGQGLAGYGKRFGNDSGVQLIGTALGGLVFPVIFHQDPRFFYKGTGTVKKRAMYAVAQAVMQRGDNGKWQPAYSGILGDFASGGISNLWLPKANRDGVATTFGEGFLAIGEDAIGNLVQEFVFRHITPHAPKYGAAGQP